MAVKAPDKQSRERYLRQQLGEIHEVINAMLEEGNARRDLAALYTKAHKIRDALDEELERQRLEAADDTEADPAAAWAELVETIRSLPMDLRARLYDEAVALRVVAGED